MSSLLARFDLKPSHATIITIKENDNNMGSKLRKTMSNLHECQVNITLLLSQYFIKLYNG